MVHTLVVHQLHKILILGDIGTITFSNGLQGAGTQKVIRIQKFDKLPFGDSVSAVESSPMASIDGVTNGQHSVVVLGYDFSGVVGRGIVNDNQLDIAKVLIQNAINSLPEIFCIIEIDNDY